MGAGRDFCRSAALLRERQPEEATQSRLFAVILEKAVEPRSARRPRRKTGEAWFLSPHPAGEWHPQGKVLLLFVIFVIFVVN